MLAIKTGRYTHEKRAKDIAEVKRLERLQIESGPFAHSYHNGAANHIPNGAAVALTPFNVEFEQVVQRVTGIYVALTEVTHSGIAERENEFLVSALCCLLFFVLPLVTFVMDTYHFY